MPKQDPFKLAERFITLRKKYDSPSWGDMFLRLNELIINPIIILCLLFVGAVDFFMVLSGAMSTYNAWNEWIEYNDTRFQIQMMHLQMMKVGGPFIRTNDPTYLPYVYADAVIRGQHH